jgi:ATP-dependent 26S proteasome regulatory subunit
VIVSFYEKVMHRIVQSSKTDTPVNGGTIQKALKQIEKAASTRKLEESMSFYQQGIDTLIQAVNYMKQHNQTSIGGMHRDDLLGRIKNALLQAEEIKTKLSNEESKMQQRLPSPPPRRSKLHYDKNDPFIETIKRDMYIDSKCIHTKWDDISGLTLAKQALQEAAILPLLRPDLYAGLRSPPNAVLLYGPPGTGKTMLVKAVAHESQCILFSCSASSITSKWVGESEKLVRTLFQMAEDVAPSIIFIDEMDALLGRRRSEGSLEQESSRRFKTEFMVQMDGITAMNASDNILNKRVLLIGCTNCPWDIDDAIIRRFQRRIYIPLPDSEARRSLWLALLRKSKDIQISPSEVTRLVYLSKGFSCSDIASIANEAAFGPLRELRGGIDAIKNVNRSDVRPIQMKDFESALNLSKKSVSPALLRQYDDWEKEQSPNRT